MDAAKTCIKRKASDSERSHWLLKIVYAFPVSHSIPFFRRYSIKKFIAVDAEICIGIIREKETFRLIRIIGRRHNTKNELE